MSKNPITHLSREEMERILDAECPGMSAPTRAAVLQGVPLDMGDGRTLQAPKVPDDGKPTHHVAAQLQKVGTEWRH